MAVLTNSLADAIKRATSPPGVDLHPDAQPSTWQGYAEDAFWTAVLQGVITGYTIDTSGSAATHAFVTVPSGGPDMPGEIRQLIVQYAALNVISGDLMNLQTTFRAKAGPVEFETQRSAQVLVAVLKNLQAQIGLSLEQIGKLSAVNTSVFDAVINRTVAIAIGDNWWVR